MADLSRDDAQRDKWLREQYTPALRGEEPPRLTTSGATVPPVSTAADHDERSDLPGEPPYTRGPYPSMYRGQNWTMRQYAGFGDVTSTNERYRMLLASGQTGLSVAFDLPTQMGYDSDHSLADGEVGKVGVPISTIDDMRKLMDGIDQSVVSTSMTINSTAAILLAFYVAVAEERGVAAKDLRGTIQNDILKEYIARGTYIFPPAPSLRIVTSIFADARTRVPKWNTISISGYHIREAGSTAVQELAFTFANATAYVKAAIAAGLDVNRFGQQLSFFWNGHNHFFEEIAKFRASRRIWYRLMTETFGATNAKASLMRFHTQTAGSTLTAEQPENNIVRVALQALAAVLGGTQSLHTNSMDEALGLPTESAVRLALRTQQVIAHESGVTDSVDPMGGSHLVESMTDQLERDAWALMNEIESRGGSVACIESGFFTRAIADAAYRYQQEVEAGQRIVVGVNKFQTDPAPVPIQKIDEAATAAQIQRLTAFKATRDQAAAKAATERLQNAARDATGQLFEPILAAVKANVTLGEISDALRAVFGVYKSHA
jgi:methylmalonyl-CoA mutase N-terminal domain/subunit